MLRFSARTLLAAMLFLGIVPAASGDPQRLFVADPRIQFVPNPTVLASLCNTKASIRGCTEFKGRTLRSSCELVTDGWRVRASAQFIPYVFLWQPNVLGHEYEHVGDVRGWAEEYLEEISHSVFELESSCRQAAAEQERGFASRMDQWARASNRKRHSHYGLDQETSASLSAR